MQVLTSWFDLENIVGSNIGVSTFNVKGNGELHTGHEDLLTILKNNSTTSVVCFSYHNKNYTSLFGGTESTYSFDQSYCETWCQNLNIDYVVFSELNLVDLINQNFDTTAILEQVETYIQDESYNTYFTFPEVNDPLKINDLKSFLFFHLVKNQINPNINNTHRKFLTWKDGICAYLQKYHVDKYNQSGLYNIVDPNRRPDGLHYSSSLLSKPESTINFYISVKALLDQWGSNQIDKTALDQACLDLEEGTIFQVRVPYYYENMFGFNKLCECNILDTTSNKSFSMVEKY
jgi:hypothetical protein